MRTATLQRCLLLLCVACAPTWAWQTFTPAAFTIQRIVGQLGFATEVEWQYYADGEKKNRNPLDPNQPSRTVEASGISVRSSRITRTTCRSRPSYCGKTSAKL